MAVIEQEKDQNQVLNSSGGSSTSPTSSYTANKTPQGSGRFTNIQKYLTANQGGGQKVQQGIEKKTENEAQAVRQGIQAAQQNFGQKASAEQQRLQQGQQFIGQAVQNAPTLSDEDVNRFTQLRTGQGEYQNLTGINSQPLQQQAQNLSRSGQLAGSEQGRFQLLKQSFARPTYSQGQKKLDQLLLQTQQPGQLQKNLTGISRDVTGQLTSAEQQAQQQAQNLKQLGQQVSQEATQASTGAVTSLDELLKNRATTYDQEADIARRVLEQAYQRPEALTGDITTMPVGGGFKLPGSINQDELGATERVLERSGLSNLLSSNFYGGLDENQRQAILGQMDVAAPTIAQAATEEDKARYLALARLAGQNPTTLQQDTAVGGYNPLAALQQDRLNQINAESQTAYNAAEQQKRASQTRLQELANYDRDLRSTIDPVAQNANYQLNNLRQQQAQYLPDDPRRQALDAQINSLQSQVAQEQQRVAGLNLRNRQMGLHLGEDEFAHGSGNYGNLMGQRLSQADSDIARQQQTLNQYRPQTLSERLRALLGGNV